jgi:hypothetical protein
MPRRQVVPGEIRLPVAMRVAGTSRDGLDASRLAARPRESAMRINDRDDGFPGGYVPCCQDDTYSSCSGVMGSSVIPSAASFSRATSASIISGTT